VRRRSDLPAYLALRAAVAPLLALPRGAALGAGATLGRVARAPLGLRRAVADRNLALAFPEMPPAARDAVCRGMYAHFGRLIVDSLRSGTNGGREVVPLVRAEPEIAVLRELLKRGRGVLVLTGHLGCWEAGIPFLVRQGMQLTAVWKPQANPYVAAYLDRLRGRLGLDAIPMPEARTGVPAALRAGKVVAMVADQAPIRGDLRAPFFGRLTRTFSGPGHFAAQTGAPVVVGGILAESDGGFRGCLEVLDEAPRGGADELVPRIAAQYRAALERLIRAAPEQYLWTHKLWREEPAA
jgi:Kdo2-lipid IVA lauroyltransferase/acyltransferase